MFLMNEMAIDMHLKSRQQYFEHGERASKMLTHQLKQMAAANYISAIKDKNGNIVTDQLGISNQFKTFYEELYTSEHCEEGLVEDFHYQGSRVRRCRQRQYRGWSTANGNRTGS